MSHFLQSVGTFDALFSSFGQTVVSSERIKLDPLAEGLGDFKGKGLKQTPIFLCPVTSVSLAGQESNAKYTIGSHLLTQN